MATATEVCPTCSSGEITNAKGFQPTDDAVRSYYTNVQTEWAKLTLPGISEKVEWTVYKLSPPGAFKHYSLLFVCEDIAYRGSPGFTFELVCVVGEQSGNNVTPKTTVMKKGSGTTKLGVIRGSAKAIIKRGLQCLVEFGDYQIITNNCQKFCQKLAGGLGISQPWTDSDKAVALGGLALLGGTLALGLALFSSPSGSSDQQKEQKKRRH